MNGAFNTIKSTLTADWDAAKKAYGAFGTPDMSKLKLSKLDGPISPMSVSPQKFGIGASMSTLWNGLGKTADGHSNLVAGGKVAGYGIAGMATMDFLNPFSFGWGD